MLSQNIDDTESRGRRQINRACVAMLGGIEISGDTTVPRTAAMLSAALETTDMPPAATARTTSVVSEPYFAPRMNSTASGTIHAKMTASADAAAIADISSK